MVKKGEQRLLVLQTRQQRELNNKNAVNQEITKQVNLLQEENVELKELVKQFRGTIQRQRQKLLDNREIIFQLTDSSTTERSSTEINIDQADPGTDEGTCCICLNEQSRILSLNCAHLCMCSECFKDLKSRRKQKSLLPKCPICQKLIKSSKKVFFA
jgi:hypothetical protein